jgi:hypothetical protein
VSFCLPQQFHGHATAISAAPSTKRFASRTDIFPRMRLLPSNVNSPPYHIPRPGEFLCTSTASCSYSSCIGCCWAATHFTSQSTEPIPDFVVHTCAPNDPTFKVFLICEMKRTGESVDNARTQLNNYFDRAGVEMEEYGGTRAYGLLTIGASWELYKFSLARGKMERISAGEDFTSDEAVKTLYYIKRTLEPMSPLPPSPLAVTTPPMRRSATGDTLNWSNSWEELRSISSSSLSFGSDDLSGVVREGRNIIGVSSVGDASIRASDC